MLEGLQRAAGTGRLQVIAVNLESASVFHRQVARMTDFQPVLTRDCHVACALTTPHREGTTHVVAKSNGGSRRG